MIVQRGLFQPQLQRLPVDGRGDLDGHQRIAQQQAHQGGRAEGYADRGPLQISLDPPDVPPVILSPGGSKVSPAPQLILPSDPSDPPLLYKTYEEGVRERGRALALLLLYRKPGV